MKVVSKISHKWSKKWLESLLCCWVLCVGDAPSSEITEQHAGTSNTKWLQRIMHVLNHKLQRLTSRKSLHHSCHKLKRSVCRAKCRQMSYSSLGHYSFRAVKSQLDLYFILWLQRWCREEPSRLSLSLYLDELLSSSCILIYLTEQTRHVFIIYV